MDVATDLLRLADQNHWPVLLVGGRGYGQSDISAAQTLAIPNVNPAIYWLAGYKRATQPTAAEEQLVSETLKKLKPKIVLVALGAPVQEEWALRHRQLLKNNGVKIVVVVGGAFDYVLGRVPRAPRWLRQLGWEWLFRLIQQPWRWQRQLRLIKFTWLILREVLT